MQATDVVEESKIAGTRKLALLAQRRKEAEDAARVLKAAEAAAKAAEEQTAEAERDAETAKAAEESAAKVTKSARVRSFYSS